MQTTDRFNAQVALANPEAFHADRDAVRVHYGDLLIFCGEVANEIRAAGGDLLERAGRLALRLPDDLAFVLMRACVLANVNIRHTQSGQAWVDASKERLLKIHKIPGRRGEDRDSDDLWIFLGYDPNG